MKARIAKVKTTRETMTKIYENLKKIFKQFMATVKQIYSEPTIQRNLSSKNTLIIRTIGISFFALLLWASFFEIEQTTRAQGQIIPISRSQIIQSFDGGVLEELMVREGDKVERDQVLAKLNKSRAQSSLQETKAKAAALSGAVSRLRAEVYGKKLVFDDLVKEYPEFRSNQIILFEKRQKAINDELSALKAQAELAKTELSMTEPLLKTGDVSVVEVIKLKRQVNDIEGQIANKKNKYFQDAQAELSKSEEELTGTLEILTQKKEQLERVELKSPMAGTVKNIRITTLGGVIKAGEEVMQVVPLGDDLMIEAKVRPSDIGFLKLGLPAIVKIDAYDYSIYGVLRGQVTFISPDTLTDETKTTSDQTYYRVQIQTKGTKFSGKPNETLEIQPGMIATAEIITGQRTVLSYLTKPITKTISESMRER